MTCRKRGHPSSWIRSKKRHSIYKRDRYTCLYCNRLILDALKYTLDHVRPRTNRGDNHHTNLVTACLSCNSSLQDKPLKDWCESKGYDYNAVRRRIRNAIRRKLP